MMIKWLVRLAFPALGVLLLLIIFGLDAPEPALKPLVKESAPVSMPAFETLVPDTQIIDTADIIFKWQDTDGNWHYADQPPLQGPWNTLAIERPSEPDTDNTEAATDWRSPYRAPFNMGVGGAGS